jgi:hypothetical protein
MPGKIDSRTRELKGAGVAGVQEFRRDEACGLAKKSGYAA